VARNSLEPKQIRVVFFAPDGEPASVWVDVCGPGPAVRLQHDYGDDLRPAAGWRAETGGKMYAIASVDDGLIRLAETTEG